VSWRKRPPALSIRSAIVVSAAPIAIRLLLSSAGRLRFCVPNRCYNPGGSTGRSRSSWSVIKRHACTPQFGFCVFSSGERKCQPGDASIMSDPLLVHAVCDAAHCRTGLLHVKYSEPNPNMLGDRDEKTSLECDCRNLDCSSCHPQCNERRYCPTVICRTAICPTATVSSWGFPYHPAPDVGVEALRQNQ
jgi:hypothetical protein